MIEVNLLPESELKGRAKRKTPKKATNPGGGMASLAIFVFAVGCMSAVGATGYYSWNQVHAAKAKVGVLQADKRVVDGEIEKLADEAQEIRHLREVFSNQWEILQSLDPPKRVLWCEKINMLSDLIPPDIFLTDLKVQEHVVEVEIQSSIDARMKWEADNRKGPQPPRAMKPVITYTLTLVGVATGADNNEQFDNANNFQKALASHVGVNAQGEKTRFMENFDPVIDFRSLEATLYEGVPVNQFTYILRTRPISSEEPSSVKTASIDTKAPRA